MDDFDFDTNYYLATAYYKNGQSTTYILNVIRQPAANNYLKFLDAGEELTPAFDRGVQYYEVEVSSSVESIVIDASPEDDKASIDGIGYYELNKGDNYIYITVTSVSGVDRVYTVKVKRSSSSDNKLASLSVNIGPLSPEFDPDINSREDSKWYKQPIAVNVRKVGYGKNHPMAVKVTDIGDLLLSYIPDDDPKKQYAMRDLDAIYKYFCNVEDATHN